MLKKKILEPERAQTIWRMRVVCRTIKPTRAQTHVRALAHTHAIKEFVTLKQVAFPQQQWFRECASMLRYTYIACLVFITVHKQLP